MNIGDKVILVSEAPYHILGHNKDRAPDFKTITITEERDSVCEFRGTPAGTGYLAKCEETGEIFTFNWPQKGGGFGNTPWVKWMPDDEFVALSEEEKDAFIKQYIWYDITNFLAPAAMKLVNNDSVLRYCDKHQRHYYTTSCCFYCKHDLSNPKEPLTMDSHKWFGWYE